MEIYNELVQWFNKQENSEMSTNITQGFIIGLWWLLIMTEMIYRIDQAVE